MLDADGGSQHPHGVPSIADLIAAYRQRTGHSYNDMARRLRNEITSQNLQKMGSLPIRQFPKTPRTIQLLAELLDVSTTTVVLAYASSLGLPVRQAGTMLEVTLPPGTDDLTVEDREAIRLITRQLIDARRQGQPPEPDYLQVQGLLLSESDETPEEGANGPGHAARPRRPADGD